MTPAEKSIVKSLIVLAWADGRIETPERSVIEGLLCGFDASDEDEQELLEFAAVPRSLDRDIPLHELEQGDRELLLANAALLMHADGQADLRESELFGQLRELLRIEAGLADEIVRSALAGAQKTASG